jgi:molybdenum cofactor cytidylyltransferase
VRSGFFLRTHPRLPGSAAIGAQNTCPMNSAHHNLATVILAAGQSRRMGRPKLLLPWRDTSVLGHLLSQWTALGCYQLTVVSAPADQIVQGELDRLKFSSENSIINLTPNQGMFSSIQAAARWGRWDAALTHWAIALGDQPHLHSETLRKLLEFSLAHPDKICQPRYGGHRCHPVVLPKAAWELLAVSQAANFKHFLEASANRISFCELDDPGLILDLDWPGDYQKALELFGKKAP